MSPELQNNLIDLAKTILSPLFTLLAVYLGYRFAIRQNKYQKKLDFVERQITNLYSPMIGYIKQIRAKGELRLELSHASGKAWGKISEAQPKPFKEHKTSFKPFQKLIDYNNKQLAGELLPMYTSMLSIFTENYWLANESTKQWYGEFCKFIDLWHRFLNDSIPPGALDELRHGEEILMPFYDDLEEQLEELKRNLGG